MQGVFSEKEIRYHWNDYTRTIIAIDEEVYLGFAMNGVTA